MSLRKTNNVEFARLLAAVLVLCSHGFTLYGLPEPFHVFTGGLSLGTLAVYIFFILSGYLIAQSWVADPNAPRFLLRRALRILPALYVFFIVGYLLVGPFITTLPADEYFSRANVTAFLKQFNVSDILGTLPGTFADNPLPNAFNGSLWTIQYEVSCYLVLLALGVVGVYKSRKLVAIAAVGFFATYLYAKFTHPVWTFLHINGAQWFDLAAFFFYASALFMWREKRWLQSLAWPAVALIAFVLLKGNALVIALHVVLPPAFLVLALRDSQGINRVGNYGDYSYGMYIYAFPVQQLLMLFFGEKISLWTFQVLTLLGTFACAFASWHLIEKQALRLKPKKRKVSTGPNPSAIPSAGVGAKAF
ncbi:acyltransferase family protein [Variovorax sp. VaC1]|uniref:acyltransferase family protein n=1 Tax=Variovorax sp. VaC1 TaxID=3373132 RepID=UPI003748F8B6